MGRKSDKLEERPDTELINQLKQGNPQAFSELVDRHQKKIFRLALGFFHDREDAQEIVQETFVRLYEKIGKFKEKNCFQSWLYRIAMNLCVDYYRKFKRKTERIGANYAGVVDQNSQFTREPEDYFDMLKFREHLQKSLFQLPKRQKLIFVLKHYGHYRYREIAGMLNVSVGCVKSLHHRSINKLKKELSQSR